MVLFSANGTNSSVLRRGDFITFYVTLSEPVPMFSTRISKFYVSTVFLLHFQERLNSEKGHKCEQICSYLLEEKESFIICGGNKCVYVKCITLCNCLLSSSSRFSANCVQDFRSVNQYSWFWKSFNMVDHGNITVNTSNNSMFLFQKAIEIDKSLISTTPRNLNEARNASPPSFCIKMLDSIFRRIYQGVNHNLLLQLFLIGFCLFAVNLEK